VSAGTFHTLKVQATTEWGDDYQRFVWINENGVIKDSVSMRGIAMNATGDTIGYVETSILYELTAYDLE
ncbi:MAG: hypothetical protein JSW49_00210, partial [candidate division WOR-3 bacterium]